MPGSSPGMTRAICCPATKQQRLRLLVPEQPQPLNPSLLLVADAVDGAGPVVGDEYRTILGENDIGRTAEIILVALKPARCEDFLLGVLAIGIDDHALIRAPWYLCRFQDPCSAIRMLFLYSAGNWSPV